MSSTFPVMAAAVPHVMVAHTVVHAQLVKVARPLVRLLAAVLTPRRKLVSVVTPTWKRFMLLTRQCIPSVRAQTYGPLEHVIVSDGPDDRLAHIPGVRFLPEHRPARNKGIWARQHATSIVSGGLIAYLDDDNAWRPHHLELLVEALDRTGADFAYGQALCTEPHGYRWVIGGDTPVFSQIDTSMIVHRRELLGLGGWQPSSGPADWDLVQRWMKQGATWVHVPVVTMDYSARTLPITAGLR